MTDSLKAPKRMLVTGGAGFIASHLCEALLSEGCEVVALDCFDAFYARKWKEQNLKEVRQTAARFGRKFTLVDADINEEGILESIEEPVDSIFHLAARAGVRPSLIAPLSYVEANISATVRLLEWARQRKIERVVFGSSSSVYGNSRRVPFVEVDGADAPISPYAATKRAGELFCATYSQLYGLKIASLRFFTVYGRRQRPDLAIRQFANKIMRGEPISLFGDGTTARDYTHVSDIVRGILSAERWLSATPAGTNEIFNIGGNKTHTLNEMVAAVEAAVGKKASLTYAPMQMGDVDRTWADLTKSERVLGFRPAMDFQNGVDDMVEWLREVNGLLES